MSEVDIDSVRKEMEIAADPKRLLQLALKQAEYDPEGMRKDIRLLDPTCVDTTKAITLKIGEHEFKPFVAYSIYTADYIRGYKNPRLLIEFDEVTMLPFVQFKADSKLNEDAPDAVELLKKFMPDDTVYSDREVWEEKRQSERKSFHLFDKEAVTEIGEFKVNALSFATEAQKTYLKRVFVLSWFFIEGTQALDDTDLTWEIYVVTNAKTQSFVGYTSVYSFLYYRTGKLFEEQAADKKPVRKRIAHFLILPPFQGQGVGKGLYLNLLKYFIGDPSVHEVEVEEPSTAFEILRDRAHYKYLTGEPEAKELLDEYSENPEEALQKLVERYKLERLQIQRVAEMYTFMENGQKETRLLKKLIKSRLWDHNYGELREMDPATQREQLHRVYENVLHMHKVALHLEEPESEDEGENEEDEENGAMPSNPAEMLLAQLVQGITKPEGPTEKKRKVSE